MAYHHCMRVLLVEDYLPLNRSLTRGLREAGFAVDAVTDGLRAREQIGVARYDVIVLDIMLPGANGLDLLKELRGAGSPTRVLLLTARDAIDDRVRGLNLGADDYLVKPFAFDELVARVRALVRRGYPVGGPRITVGDLEIDVAARRVTRAGQVIELSAREFAILEVLALRVGQVVTRQEIISRIYPDANEPVSNAVDVYVGYLRRKLEVAGAGRLIHTRRGSGYLLEMER